MNQSSVRKAFTPTGKLRASINLGNPLLANRSNETDQPFGISIDLATELARQLEVELDLVVFDAAGKSVNAVESEEADIGFFAIDPKRGEKINFTAPYVLITGSYAVRAGSEISELGQVDRSNQTVVVGRGSAYDLYLSRTLENATIIHAPTSADVVDAFFDGNYDVAAGVTQQLEIDKRRHPELHILDQPFMTIRQAMGLPKTRGLEAGSFLANFVEELKRSGFVSDAISKHRIEGATVAPPEHS
jgi:polar amino acid transport system substrate-binding protein